MTKKNTASIKPQPVKASRATGRVTITDVAHEAGVSAMTVSRALKTPTLVQKEAHARISAAIKKLGYVPNQAASTLASAKSNVIAVIVPSLTNMVFIDTLTGIRDCLGQAGYQFLIGETGYSPDRETQLISTYMRHAPDGFLLTGVEQQEEARLQLAANHIPAVRMFDLSPSSRDMTVGFSQKKAGYAIAQHMVAQGYKRPGFLAAQLDPRVMKRREGFRKGLMEAGLDPNVEVMLPSPTNVAMGASLLSSLLQQYPDCDAIFCCNDDLALGALFECQRRGLKVPQQMAIAGFNDLPWAACASPAITAIVTPRYQVGYQAAQMLVQVLKGEEPAKTRIDLGFELAVREST